MLVGGDITPKHVNTGGWGSPNFETLTANLVLECIVYPVCETYQLHPKCWICGTPLAVAVAELVLPRNQMERKRREHRCHTRVGHTETAFGCFGVGVHVSRHCFLQGAGDS